MVLNNSTGVVTEPYHMIPALVTPAHNVAMIEVDNMDSTFPILSAPYRLRVGLA